MHQSFTLHALSTAHDDLVSPPMHLQHPSSVLAQRLLHLHFLRNKAHLRPHASLARPPEHRQRNRRVSNDGPTAPSSCLRCRPMSCASRTTHTAKPAHPAPLVLPTSSAHISHLFCPSAQLVLSSPAVRRRLHSRSRRVRRKARSVRDVPHPPRKPAHS